MKYKLKLEDNFEDHLLHVLLKLNYEGIIDTRKKENKEYRPYLLYMRIRGLVTDEVLTNDAVGVNASLLERLKDKDLPQYSLYAFTHFGQDFFYSIPDYIGRKLGIREDKTEE